MSRTIRGEKGAGYEYGSRHKETKPGKVTKKLTHKKERRNLKLTLRRDYV